MRLKLVQFALFLVIISLFTLDIHSQIVKDNETIVGVLKGKVKDSVSLKPIEYVQIKLLSAIDSSVVSGIYSNEKGEFELTKLPNGKFIVKLFFLGYSTKFIYNISISQKVLILHNSNIR